MIGFSAGKDGRSPLDALVREGARKMLQAALESEVEAFLEQHAGRVDDQGRRQVVRNAEALSLVCGAMGAADSFESSAAELKLSTLATLYGISQQLRQVRPLRVVVQTLPDLRELFDAAARDRGGLCDEDLPQSPQALRKAIQRLKPAAMAGAWDIF